MKNNTKEVLMKKKNVCKTLKWIGFGGLAISTVAAVVCSIAVPSSVILPVSIGLMSSIMLTAGTMLYGSYKERAINNTIYQLAKPNGFDIQKQFDNQQEKTLTAEQENLENTVLQNKKYSTLKTKTKIKDNDQQM